MWYRVAFSQIELEEHGCGILTKLVVGFRLLLNYCRSTK